MLMHVVEGTKTTSQWFLEHRAWASSERLFKAVVGISLVEIAILISIFEATAATYGCEEAFELLDKIYIAFEGKKLFHISYGCHYSGN